MRKMQTFYGNMNWFDVEECEQPDGFDVLPEAFQLAKRLWDEDADGNIDKIIEMLSPFVRAYFFPTNINGWEELFVDGMAGSAARDVTVVGIYFRSGPIPLCKAEAILDVEVTDNFASADLEQLGLYDGVSFVWEIPGTDETEDLHFSWGDHQGAECHPMEE